MKNFELKSKGATEKFGVSVTVNKDLDRYKGQILFPKKLEKITEIIKQLKPR